MCDCIKNLLRDKIIKILKFIIEFFVSMIRVGMSSLLSVTIPQICYTRDNTRQICTVSNKISLLFDNSTNSLDVFNKATLIINIITLFILIIHYVIIWLREKFIIKHFTIDKLFPKIHLYKELQHNQHIKKKLNYHNKVLYLSTIIISVFVGINFLFSIVVVYYYYLDYTSIISILSNLVLIKSLIESSFNCSSASNKYVLSVIDYEHTCYNVVKNEYLPSEASYLRHPGFYRRITGVTHTSGNLNV